MSERAYPVWLLLFVASLALPRVSSAEPVVIYSNFGPAPGYLVGDWVPIQHQNPQASMNSDGAAYYMGFQLNEPAQLTSITLPIVWGGVLPEGFSLTLRGSENGQAVAGPRGVIERLVLPLPADAEPRNVSLASAESVAQPLLAADTLYFLGVFATGSTATDPAAWNTLWPWNNAGIEGTVVNFNVIGIGIRHNLLGAFQLQGEPAPIPEPATLLLVAAGGGAILTRARRRSHSR